MESNSISANPAATFTRQSRWILASREELNGGAIAWSEICASECIARLLLRKGFHSAEEVENFLRPRLNSLSDPFLPATVVKDGSSRPGQPCTQLPNLL